MTTLSSLLLCTAIRWQQPGSSVGLIRILNDWTLPPPLTTSSIKDMSFHGHPQIKLPPQIALNKCRHITAREIAVWSVLSYTKERHPRDVWWQFTVPIWTLYSCRPYKLIPLFLYWVQGNDLVREKQLQQYLSRLLNTMNSVNQGFCVQLLHLCR